MILYAALQVFAAILRSRSYLSETNCAQGLMSGYLEPFEEPLDLSLETNVMKTFASGQLQDTHSRLAPSSHSRCIPDTKDGPWQPEDDASLIDWATLEKGDEFFGNAYVCERLMEQRGMDGVKENTITMDMAARPNGFREQTWRVSAGHCSALDWSFWGSKVSLSNELGTRKASVSFVGQTGKGKSQLACWLPCENKQNFRAIFCSHGKIASVHAVQGPSPGYFSTTYTNASSLLMEWVDGDHDVHGEVEILQQKFCYFYKTDMFQISKSTPQNSILQLVSKILEDSGSSDITIIVDYAGHRAADDDKVRLLLFLDHAEHRTANDGKECLLRLLDYAGHGAAHDDRECLLRLLNYGGLPIANRDTELVLHLLNYAGHRAANDDRERLLRLLGCPNYYQQDELVVGIFCWEMTDDAMWASIASRLLPDLGVIYSILHRIPARLKRKGLFSDKGSLSIVFAPFLFATGASAESFREGSVPQLLTAPSSIRDWMQTLINAQRLLVPSAVSHREQASDPATLLLAIFIGTSTIALLAQIGRRDYYQAQIVGSCAAAAVAAGAVTGSGVQELVFEFLFWGCVAGVVGSTVVHTVLGVGGTNVGEGQMGEDKERVMMEGVEGGK